MHVVTTSELQRLISAYLDGCASDNDVDRLSTALRSDSAARDLYLQLADLHACLTIGRHSFRCPPLQLVASVSNPGLERQSTR